MTFCVLNVLGLRACVQVLWVATATVATFVVDLQLARVSVGQLIAQSMSCLNLLTVVSIAIAMAPYRQLPYPAACPWVDLNSVGDVAHAPIIPPWQTKRSLHKGLYPLNSNV